MPEVPVRNDRAARMWDCNYAEMMGRCKPRPLWDEEGKCRSYQPRRRRKKCGYTAT